MTDVEDPQVRFQRYSVFVATDLGRLYLAHENALINYWKGDAASDQQMMELDKASREATHAFVSKLMELSGV